MQYLSAAQFARDGQSLQEVDPIRVRLAGPAGTRTLTLRWGEHTCNQVSHGC